MWGGGGSGARGPGFSVVWWRGWSDQAVGGGGVYTFAGTKTTHKLHFEVFLVHFLSPRRGTNHQRGVPTP